MLDLEPINGFLSMLILQIVILRRDIAKNCRREEYFAINKISTKKKEENVQATVNEFPLEGGVLL